MEPGTDTDDEADGALDGMALVAHKLRATASRRILTGSTRSGMMTGPIFSERANGARGGDDHCAPAHVRGGHRRSRDGADDAGRAGDADEAAENGAPHRNTRE